ncbi:serine-type endopeptidase-like protein [Paraphoma chrysanthemicola]|uniref:Serine-type endopeptidase-like protein n=1 Tax=Paraphoma chrysanthemicola TaxID=798071 RepID=A0A8K0RF60_9PLEO|nr:serine-type endopeptidase-like protein [Paraphoma chrysanthemicola]
MMRALLLLPLVASAAAEVASNGVIQRSFIVEFEQGQDLSSYHSKVDPVADTVKTFDYSLFKGATIQFKNDEAAALAVAELRALDSVKNIWPNRLHERPEFNPTRVVTSVASALRVKRQAINDTFSPHLETQVDKLHAEGITGKGVTIAIVDSGIDYNHPALGGCFGPNCLVARGHDFVGNNYTGFNDPIPDDDPMDCSAHLLDVKGHGTHVAGIIAAQPNEYGFTGAAPGVKLAVYRVFGCEGGAAENELVDASMRAFEDGADIITASVGGTGGWEEDVWSTVINRIVQSGVPFLVAAGNEGSSGLFASSVNGTAIASYNTNKIPIFTSPANFSVDDGSSQDIVYLRGTPGFAAGVRLPLWTPSFNTSEIAQGCSPLPDNTPDLSGNIVLIRRGGCTFLEKAQNAVARGARHVLLYDNGVIPAFVTVSVDGLAGIGMVMAETGVNFVNTLASGSEVVLEIVEPDVVQLVVINNTVNGGHPARDTSWSPTYEAKIKPQFGAPGGDILSTIPLSQGGFGVDSGTSMATPFAAAVYALVRESRGPLNPNTLERLLSATANPNLLNDGVQTFPWLAPVAQQGAGIVQAWDAAHAVTFLSRPNIAFNDTDYLDDTTNFTIINTGNEAVTYEIGTVGAATAYTFSDGIVPDPFPGMTIDGTFAQLSLSDSRVTVPARSEAAITVIVTPPSIEARRLPVYSGYITLNASNGENLSLPYQGIVGSLNAQTVLGSWSVFANATSEVPITSNGTLFTLSLNSTDTSVPIPAFQAEIVFGSPFMSVVAVRLSDDSSNTTVVGDILDSPSRWEPRGSPFWNFNGRMADDSFLPAGRYRMRVRALHIFGDSESLDESQWDQIDSPDFEIRYA